MSAYPHFPKRRIHDLNQAWDFAFLPDVNLDKLTVTEIEYTDRLPAPSAFDAMPAYAGRRGSGVYRCFVQITPGMESALKIGGAGMTCLVYVDGRKLIEHVGTYTPFEVVLPAVDNSRREIVVVTDNRYDYERNPLHENFFDFYNYGGIIRPVTLHELPKNPLKNAYVTVEDYKTGEITVKLDFYKAAGQNVSCSFDESNTWNEISLDSEQTTFRAQVPDPTAWSPENPILHTLTIDTGDDAITVRFGLRQIRCEHGSMLLNDDPLKLLGYCRHEAHPQFGPATPVSLMAADLQLLRDLGCNFIRGAHYQQDARFLDLCDELGFLVFSESLSWQASEKQLNDSKFVEAQLAQTRAMVETDFNHPSIILWGFLNEGESQKEYARTCYEGLINLIRSLDPSRPVTYACNRGLDDLFLEQLDVISCNMYPGWYSANRDNERPLDEIEESIDTLMAGLKQRGLTDKPFIISEIGAGAIYGCRDELAGYWSEQYQADYLDIVCRKVVENPDITGVALWQFCDIRTYQGPGCMGRPRGFNNKGTVDEYRRPKKAFDTVKSIFTGA